MGFFSEIMGLFEVDYDLSNLRSGRIEITGEKVMVLDLSGDESGRYDKNLEYNLSKMYENGFYISVRERFLEDIKNNIELRGLNEYGELSFAGGEFSYSCYGVKISDFIVPAPRGDLFCKYIFKIKLNGKPMKEENVRSFWKAQRVMGVSFN